MHWHWQDLNEARRYWRHGRAWFYFGKERFAYPNQKTINIEWAIGRWTGWKLMFKEGAEESDYGFSFAIGFASFYINLSGFRAYNAMKRTTWGRDTGFYYHEDHLVFKWRCDDSSWSSVDGPAHGKSKSWFVRDVLFGSAKYASTILDRVRGEIIMPEASYFCTVQLTLDTWKRPRWPWKKQLRRATVTPDVPVPVPGKGENSWDIDEDAIYESTLPAATVSEALTAFRESAMKSRERHGGKNWIPEKFRT